MGTANYGRMVKFVVPVEVNYGDSVKVVGNEPPLGSWDCSQAVALKWNEGNVWTNQVDLPPGMYEFKCVVAEGSGGTRWEPGSNRSFQVAEEISELEVACEWWNTSNTRSSVLFRDVPSRTIMNEVELVESNLLPMDMGLIGVPSDSAGSRSTVSNTEESGSLFNVNVEGQIVPAPPKLGEAAKTLKMVAAGHIIPHVMKKAKGGEDAYFITTAGRGAMGVADGVSSWGQDGVNPGRYPRTLIGYIMRAFNQTDGEVSAREALVYAQNRALVLGSSTACVAVMKGFSTLEIANLGDSGLRILRDGKIIFATKVQEHDFNTPFQLTHPNLAAGDSATDADVYEVDVEDDDIVVMGSDGLFHNIWDKDLAAVVDDMTVGQARSERAARSLASALALIAHKNAQDKDFLSPWSATVEHARRELAAKNKTGKNSMETPEPQKLEQGGKMDDCTVVVGFINHN